MDDDNEELEEPELDEEVIEDLDDVDLTEDLGEEFDGDDDVIVGDELDDDDDDLVDVLDVAEDEVEARPVAAAVAPDDEEDDDDELDPDDIEASLDDILKDRLVIEDAETDDDEVPDTDDRSEGNSVVVPKRPDEFVCQSCFLVKHPSQIADPVRQLCRDCV